MSRLLFIAFFVGIAAAVLVSIPIGVYLKSTQPKIASTSYPTPNGTSKDGPPAVLFAKIPYESIEWKTYESQNNNVSFLYPSNETLVFDRGNTITIGRGMAFILQITKIDTPLSVVDWWSNDKENNPDYVTSQPSIFNETPAILVKEKNPADYQVPENIIIVKTNNTTIYKIEYAITVSGKNDDSGLLTKGIKKILDSIKFLD